MKSKRPNGPLRALCIQRSRLYISSIIFLSVLLVFMTSGWSQNTEKEESTQTETPLSYAMQVELAQIVVRVLTKDGEWVDGLKPSDLVLTEDGQPAEVKYVDEFKAQSAEAPAPPPAPGEPPTIVPVTPAYPNSILIIFDSCNSSQVAIRKHKEFVKKFLSDFDTKNTIFSLVEIKPTGDYEMLVNFTSQRSPLLQAIENIKGGFSGFQKKQSEASKLLDTSIIEGCPRSGANQLTCIENALDNIITKADAFAQDEQVRSSNSIRSLRKLFAVAEHIPGQKSVVLISEGMDPAGSFYYNFGANVIDQFIRQYSLPPLASSYITRMQSEANRYMDKIREMRDLVRSANASGLVVYWANPEFGKKIEDISTEFSSTSALSTKLLNASDKELAMAGFAEDTGGFAVRSSDLSKFYKQVARQISNYYLVSYKPLRQVNDGKFHRVEVEAKNKDYVVHYGKEFKDFQVKDRVSNQLAAAHDFPEVGNHFPMRAEVRYFMKSDGKYNVMIQTAIPYEEIEPQKTEAGVVDDIHLSFIVRDRKGNIVVDTHPILKFRATHSDFDRFRNDKAFMEYVYSAKIDPGTYEFSLAAMDVSGWKTASAKFPVELPGSVAKCPTISPVLLAGGVRKADGNVSVPTATEKGEIQYKDSVFSFPVKRVFPTQGSLAGFYQVYNAKLPAGYISFKLYRGDSDFINETPEREIKVYDDPLQKLISNFFSVPYKNLAPGSYTLEIRYRQASDGCSTTTRIPFDIGTGAAG